MKFPERFRITANNRYKSNKGDPFGAFYIQRGGGRDLLIIACDGEETGWEHVSVSLPAQKKKTPSWKEMCEVKDLFWEEEEVVIQFHPAKSENISFHDGCLHLWKSTHETFPLPDPIMVGPIATT